MPPTEHDILTGILDYLQRIRHIYCWRNNTGAFKVGERFIRTGKVGSADILGVLPDGRFLAIEVKRRGGKTTPAQDEFLDIVRRNGGVAFVAYELDDVIRSLDAPAGDWKLQMRKK